MILFLHYEYSELGGSGLLLPSIMKVLFASVFNKEPMLSIVHTFPHSSHIIHIPKYGA